MKQTCLLIKSRKSKTTIRGCKVIVQLLGVFVFLIVGIFSFSIAEANDFESSIKDLGNKSRSKIKLAVKRLGNIGNPAALPALEALKDNHLQISSDGSLIILNESEDQGRYALSGNPVDLSSLTLHKHRINNSVRRVL